MNRTVQHIVTVAEKSSGERKGLEPTTFRPINLLLYHWATSPSDTFTAPICWLDSKLNSNCPYWGPTLHHLLLQIPSASRWLIPSKMECSNCMSALAFSRKVVWKREDSNPRPSDPWTCCSTAELHPSLTTELSYKELLSQFAHNWVSMSI